MLEIDTSFKIEIPVFKEFEHDSINPDNHDVYTIFKSFDDDGGCCGGGCCGGGCCGGGCYDPPD